MTEPCRLDHIQAALIELATAAEGRNITTRGHSERVALTAHGLAREMDLPLKLQDRLLLLGRLHNIGIVHTRDSVLTKNSSLTDDEYEHIKLHTVLGHQILSGIPGLEDAAEICLTHHERWDGSGYPSGLKGEDIPLTARIMGVADTFCAITSERPHRDSMPRPVAADEIAENLGTRFCPDCAAAFARWFERTSGRIDLPEGV